MNRLLGQLRVFGAAAAKQAKVRKGLVAALAAFLVLQVYFVRELLAAELLFGLLFAVVLAIGGIVYALGTVGERVIDVGEAGARVIANSTRRGFVLAEEIGKKSARYLEFRLCAIIWLRIAGRNERAPVRWGRCESEGKSRLILVVPRNFAVFGTATQGKITGF